MDVLGAEVSVDEERCENGESTNCVGGLKVTATPIHRSVVADDQRNASHGCAISSQLHRERDWAIDLSALLDRIALW
jgi:hypothetical protein